MKIRHLITILCTSVVVGCGAQAAPSNQGLPAQVAAIQEALTGGSEQLVITRVEISPNQLEGVIHGVNFANGEQPIVKLGGKEQTINSFTDTQIKVALDLGLVDGSYLLNVITGSSVNQNDAFEVSIGSAGSVGPTGPAGPQGSAGANGAQGLTGLTGPQGPTGANGAQGPVGLQGPAGADGADGFDGADGADGVQGPAGSESPVSPGETIQYSIDDIVTAPDANWVTAYEVLVPRNGGFRIEYRLYETGSPVYRSAQSQIFHNDVGVATYNTTSNGSELSVNHDLDNITAGDKITIKIRVQNIDQAPYIDANIQNFKLKTIEPPINFVRLK